MELSVFSGTERIVSGTLEDIAEVVRNAAIADLPLLAFDDQGRVRDLDLRGSVDDIIWRNAEPPAPRPGRGRPKLGVVAKEVTLLPRHWRWLMAQPGGASATLRQLVDAAQKGANAGALPGRDAAYRFLTAIAGDLPNYEEVIRALYANDAEGFVRHMAGWPPDITRFARDLATRDRP